MRKDKCEELRTSVVRSARASTVWSDTDAEGGSIVAALLVRALNHHTQRMLGNLLTIIPAEQMTMDVSCFLMNT